MAWRRGQTYSQDLRDRVLAADALTARQAAERFGVSVSYVVKARQRLVRTGAPTPRPQKPPAAQAVAVPRGAAGAGGAGAGRDPGRAPRVAGRGARGGGRADDGLEGAPAAHADAQKSPCGRPSRADPTSPKRGG